MSRLVDRARELAERNRTEGWNGYDCDEAMRLLNALCDELTATSRDPSEIWSVRLRYDFRGNTMQEGLFEVTINPPFGIRCADAETKAIREAEARGKTNVRAIASKFARYVTPATSQKAAVGIGGK